MKADQRHVPNHDWANITTPPVDKTKQTPATEPDSNPSPPEAAGDTFTGTGASTAQTNAPPKVVNFPDSSGPAGSSDETSGSQASEAPAETHGSEETPDETPNTPGEASSETSEAAETESSPESSQESQNNRQFDDSMENILAMMRDNELSSNDPQVMLALQEMIREMEDRNIKTMLDMIQQSLDRAAEMREQRERDYLQKELPQQQALEAQIQQLQIQAESMEQSAMQTAVEQLDAQVHNLGRALQLQASAIGDNQGAQLSMAAAQALTQALKSQISTP